MKTLAFLLLVSSLRLTACSNYSEPQPQANVTNTRGASPGMKAHNSNLDR